MSRIEVTLLVTWSINIRFTTSFKHNPVRVSFSLWQVVTINDNDYAPKYNSTLNIM